jgi:hypothetical protein
MPFRLVWLWLEPGTLLKERNSVPTDRHTTVDF